MSDRGYKSPGVSFSENEIFPEVKFPEDLTVGVVGGAIKGPLTLTRIQSASALEGTFGRFGNKDYALWAARKVILAGGIVLFQRVVGADAAYATTATTEGEETETTPPLTFVSKEYRSDLNDAIIQIKVNAEKKVLDYTLSKDGVVIETLGNLSLDKTEYSYFKNIIDRVSLFNVTVNSDEVADVTLTVRDGNDGISSLKTEDYIGTGNSGIQVFKNPENVDVSTLIVPGVSDTKLFEAVEEVIDYRGDLMYIPDCPVGQSPKQIIDWANETVGTTTWKYKFDSSQISLYYPWIWDTNPYTKERMITPPSGWVASKYVYTDKVAGQWFAPAGLQTDYARGKLEDALDVEYEMSKEERDAIYDEANINPIAKFYGKGIALWGNRTTLRTPQYQTPSVYTSINVRRMVNYIRKVIISISLTELFNPNDTTTWKSWKQKVTPKLRAIKENRGITAFQIVMDESTVTADDIQNGRMPGEIYIQPTRAAEFIPINFTVTQDSVIFSEVGEVE